MAWSFDFISMNTSWSLMGFGILCPLKSSFLEKFVINLCYKCIKMKEFLYCFSRIGKILVSETIWLASIGQLDCKSLWSAVTFQPLDRILFNPRMVLGHKRRNPADHVTEKKFVRHNDYPLSFKIQYFKKKNQIKQSLFVIKCITEGLTQNAGVYMYGYHASFLLKIKTSHGNSSKFLLNCTLPFHNFFNKSYFSSMNWMLISDSHHKWLRFSVEIKDKDFFGWSLTAIYTWTWARARVCVFGNMVTVGLFFRRGHILHKDPNIFIVPICATQVALAMNIVKQPPEITHYFQKSRTKKWFYRYMFFMFNWLFN